MLLPFLEVFTNLKREVVRFSCTDILRKIPEVFVTQRRQTAYVYIGHTCRVDSFSACERQTVVFALQIALVPKTVHFFLFFFQNEELINENRTTAINAVEQEFWRTFLKLVPWSRVSKRDY
jgi:hypothetical protein